MTGAGSGMGRATAHLFGDEGAAVAVVDRDGTTAERVAGEVGGAGGRALAVTTDLGNRAAIGDLVTIVRQELGPVDIVVNNAGISVPAPLADEGWEAALGATASMSPYTASKHGVIGLTRSLAVELGSSGVTVNCVCPGPIRTGMTAAIPEDAKTKFARRRVPLRRYGDPEEVAHATLSLVLPASSYINGAVLVVDGGMLAQNT